MPGGSPGLGWAIARRRVRFGGVEAAEWLRAALGGRLDDARAVEAFEGAFSRVAGEGRPAVAFTSGRSALGVLLAALGLPAGSRVVLAAWNDESVPAAIEAAGLVPRFVDVEEATHGIDPAATEAALAAAGSHAARAIVATHLFGNPCDLASIREIAARRGVVLIEDCAHALGVRVSGRPLGTFGDASFFSFSPTKPFSALGGGLALAADEVLGARLRAERGRLAPPARAGLVRAGAAALALSVLTRPAVFSATLYPCLLALAALRLDPIDAYRATAGRAIRGASRQPARLARGQAHVGLAMLDGLDRETRARVALARRLRERIPPEVWSLPGEGTEATGAYFFLLRSPDPVRLSRRLLARRIDTGARVMRPCHRLFGNTGDFPVTDALYRETLQLPLEAAMGEEGVERTARAIRLEWEARPGLFRRADEVGRNRGKGGR